MDPTRRAARTAGVLFLVTHATSIPAALVYASVLEPGAVPGAGGESAVLVAALLEVVLALGVVGTAVVLYPLVRGEHEGLALGYVALRTLEAGVVLVGVVAVLAATATPGPGGVRDGLLAVHDATFLVGPGLVCAGGNTLVLAWLLYRSGQVPRFIPVLGLVGGPLVAAANAGELLGLSDGISGVGGLLVVPILAWEVCLAVHLITRGIRPARRPVTAPAAPVPATV
ncbi:DUF4386 domain-containing protein [Trujillonella endophytica]|uniref:DUF4386 domain-containing protein n=1 Tax=Trujillonella endophytica TaxID=673521 RepID=A0A1H8S858_9ACTN|nr:DUF4386 domain-containing protein [Trujillella endophytica]SEO74851.1 protein of unknown function [Trujillella endophytica]